MIDEKTGAAKEVYVVDQGAGLFELRNLTDNRQWSGLFNHIVGEARIAGWLAVERVRAGDTRLDPQMVVDGVFADHLGKRQYVEAVHYPHLVRDSEVKRADGADAVVVKTKLLKQHPQINPELITLALETATDGDKPVDKVKSLEGKIIAYADLRFDQKVVTRRERLMEMLDRNRIPAYKANSLGLWSTFVETELFASIPFSPEDITDNFPSQPSWEQDLRLAYLEDVKVDAFNRIAALQKNPTQLDIEFPLSGWWGWWGGTMRNLYAQNRKSY